MQNKTKKLSSDIIFIILFSRTPTKHILLVGQTLYLLGIPESCQPSVNISSITWIHSTTNSVT